MKITKTIKKVKDLCENYIDNNDDGVFGYNNRLEIRPPYQREYVFSNDKRDKVIDSIRQGFPINIMYWSKIGDDIYELLDGQQRTISIAQFVGGDFCIKIDGNDKFFHNLTDNEKHKILDYELDVYVCEGTEEEKLAWFKVINTGGVVLTNQELLNATYTGPWLSDAKRYFSKRNCVAGNLAEGFISGNPIRQDYLEKVLSWIADRDGLSSGQQYMAIHQHDTDANDLWVYFQTVINWAKMLFSNLDKKITSVQDWGILYNKYKNKTYNTNTLYNDIQVLLQDDDVTKQAGIIPYVLSERTKHDEKLLSIRAFSIQQKRRKYEEQGHKCAICGKVFEFEELEGDHITRWSNGGRTVEENLQMICKQCNLDKSNK